MNVWWQVTSFIYMVDGDEFIIGGPNFLSLYSYSSEINLLDEVVNYYMMIPALQPNEIIIDCAALNFEKLKVVVTNQNRFILFKGSQHYIHKKVNTSYV